MIINKLITPLSEKEIIDRWDSKEVIVSVICCTYNQEKYIEDTILGVLCQNTSYRYEFIIHDDCSTDSTSNIIKKYADNYPNIIKHIIPPKNIYSQGIQPGINAFSFTTGKYIALCEGDDFWIDENKITKQVEILEIEKSINLCFSSAYTLQPNGKIEVAANYNDEIFISSLSTVIRQGGAYMPTASIIFRREVFILFKDNFSRASIGDYYCQILGSIGKGAIYLPDITCVYRINSVGSWSENRKNINKEFLISEINEYEKYLYKLINLGVDKKDIDFALADLIRINANQLFLKKEWNGSKSLIIKSWNLYKGINRNQEKLYLYRNFLPILFIREKIKMLLKKIKFKKNRMNI
ncbi:glycosyltransferase [Proteus terrae]|uniref:glycosyltransferase n=1 Tax=Proteus terrae TaxID=1574161 RepID=UPI00298BE868|nr:glycosyltransferase [Proteus terrae]WPC99176.1 glycosyltransferase [Proteus terrae]